MTSITLPRSPASLSSGDEVPHIFTRKSRLWPKEILIASAKRLLQQNRHEAAETVLLGYLRRGACAAAAVGAAKLCQLSEVAVVRVAEVKLGQLRMTRTQLDREPEKSYGEAGA